MKSITSKRIQNLSILIMLFTSCSFTSCQKKNCQTCTKIIGGVAGNIVMEEKAVCEELEIQRLEQSSSGTTVWQCE